MGRHGSLFAVLLIFAVLCIHAFPQQNPAGAGAPTDAFRGRWKLNIEKSSPGYTAGMITIEPEGKRYRITKELAYRGDSSRPVWSVTDMKGGASTVTQKFGDSADEEWRIKRDGVDSFVLVAVFHGGAARVEWRYTVSPDRQTLTRRIIAAEPRIDLTPVLVFDKLP
jgi:hypothetical protein